MSHDDALNAAYRERSHLVAHLAASFPSAIGYHDPNEPDWAVVIVDLPTGQVSWHVSPHDMDLFEQTPRAEINTWDGHGTEEKYARLDAHTRALAQKEG